jgi:hypothetical protein
VPVEFSAKDERSIRIPVPANANETAKFVDWLGVGFTSGYTIKSASDIQSGDQRDPYVVGLHITMERAS